MKYLLLALLILPIFVSAYSFSPSCEDCGNLTVNRSIFDGGDHWRVELTFPEITGELHEPIPEEITYSNLTFISVAPRYENEELVWNLVKRSKITYEIRPKMDKRIFNYYLSPRVVVKEESSNIIGILMLFGFLILIAYSIGSIKNKKIVKKQENTQEMIKRIRRHIR